LDHARKRTFPPADTTEMLETLATLNAELEKLRTKGAAGEADQARPVPAAELPAPLRQVLLVAQVDCHQT